MRLIDADRLRNIAISNRDVEMVYEIDHSPTVERQHGVWKKVGGIFYRLKCSNCSFELKSPDDKNNFCPNCGADMRKEGDEK